MIKFKNISKSFGDKKILDDVSFEIKKGDTAFIIGPSGTGKSVSIKQLIGIIEPTEGSILVDGEDYFTLTSFEQRKYLSNFGVLFQSSALIAWLTIKENIALPLIEQSKLSLTEINDRTNEAIHMVNLEGAEDKFPNEISGGMQKRAGIARAIITKPKIIVYDEPTSGLDPVMSRHIDELINDMKKKLNITSLIVTHDLNSVFIAGDQVIMLHDKKVIHSSDVKSFTNSPNPIIKEFINAQFNSYSKHK